MLEVGGSPDRQLAGRRRTRPAFRLGRPYFRRPCICGRRGRGRERDRRRGEHERDGVPHVHVLAPLQQAAACCDRWHIHGALCVCVCGGGASITVVGRSGGGVVRLPKRGQKRTYLWPRRDRPLRTLRPLQPRSVPRLGVGDGRRCVSDGPRCGAVAADVGWEQARNVWSELNRWRMRSPSLSDGFEPSAPMVGADP